MRRVLLAYPQFPETFWGYQRALKLLGIRSTHPPLGLLTVAGMLPADDEVRLVDLNVSPLRDADLQWADVVLTGGMMIQRPSTEQIVGRATRLGVPVVVGGPDATSSAGELPRSAHLVLGEAESPRFLEALERMVTGGERVVLDLSGESPGIEEAPLPRYDLVELDHYASMALQMSRGCPFKCEFCDIPTLFGRTTRYKSIAQTLAELDLLFARGWRGSVFWVDDNFIGNKKVCREILPSVADWQRRHGMPFRFYTQASVNLGAEPELLELMRASGFDSVFLGIETPVESSLRETRKLQNVRFDLARSVRTIQEAGLEVMAGFIIGFDHDPEDVDRHIVRFIEEAGIPVAMVGLLTAIPGSPLHSRLAAEGRLWQVEAEDGGNNTFRFGFNFRTQQDAAQLIVAYKNVLRELFGKPRNYFRRVEVLYRRLASVPRPGPPLSPRRILALARSLAMVPTSRYGLAYARFLAATVLRWPRRFQDAVRFGIIGAHFHQLTREKLAAHDFHGYVTAALERARQAFEHSRAEGVRHAAEALAEARRRFARLPAAVRAEVTPRYEEIVVALRELTVA